MTSNLCRHPFCISPYKYWVIGKTKGLRVCRKHILWAVDRVGLPLRMQPSD